MLLELVSKSALVKCVLIYWSLIERTLSQPSVRHRRYFVRIRRKEKRKALLCLSLCGLGADGYYLYQILTLFAEHDWSSQTLFFDWRRF